MSRNTSSIARLFVPAGLAAGAEIRLDGEQAHYLGRVLRLKPDDEVRLFNGDDGEWSCRVIDIDRHRVTLSIERPLENDAESPLDIHLVQGISRGERMDFVMQKATELGVRRITPVLTHHGMVRLDAKRAARRQQHWQGVANSACEQCGRLRPPVVEAPVPLNDWFGSGAGHDALRLVLEPRAGRPLADTRPAGAELCLLVGPEGGFSEREIDDARAAGFTAVTLGPRVLRTETAAVSVLTAAQLLWGDLG